MPQLLRLPACLLPLVLTTCAADRLSRSSECGVHLGMRSSAESGARIRACTPPDADDIALACGAEEMRTVDGESVIPHFQVRAHRCRFAARDRSAADCSFEIAREDGAWHAVGARLTHTFGTSLDEVGHLAYGTIWEAKRTCGAPPPEPLDAAAPAP